MTDLVRVRIAVAMDYEGGWSAFGHFEEGNTSSLLVAKEGLSETAAVYWVEASLPIPGQHVEGEVFEG